MASMASQLIEEVTAYAQSDSLEDAREICADGTYFPNNLRIIRGSGCQQAGTGFFFVSHAVIALFSSNYSVFLVHWELAAFSVALWTKLLVCL